MATATRGSLEEVSAAIASRTSAEDKKSSDYFSFAATAFGAIAAASPPPFRAVATGIGKACMFASNAKINATSAHQLADRLVALHPAIVQMCRTPPPNTEHVGKRLLGVIDECTELLEKFSPPSEEDTDAKAHKKFAAWAKRRMRELAVAPKDFETLHVKIDRAVQDCQLTNIVAISCRQGPSADDIRGALAQDLAETRKLLAAATDGIDDMHSSIQELNATVMGLVRGMAKPTLASILEAWRSAHLSSYPPETAHVPGLCSSTEALNDTLPLHGADSELSKFLAGTSAHASMLLVGGAGSGKSTAARELVLDLLGKWVPGQPGSLFPIYVPLAQVSSSQSGLLAAFEDVAGADSLRELRTQRTLPLLFVLDGYDELPSTAKVNLIRRHRLEEFHESKVLITCRPESCRVTAFFAFDRAPLTVRHMRPFSLEQRHHYIEHLSSRSDADANALEWYDAQIQALRIQELLDTPLMIRMAIDVIDSVDREKTNSSGGTLVPTAATRLRRSQLYEKFVNQWIHREVARLGEQGAAMDDVENAEVDVKEFFNALATEMWTRGMRSVNMKEDPWKSKYFDRSKHTIARSCGPLKYAGSFASLVHGSFIDFFTIAAIAVNDFPSALTTLSSRTLTIEDMNFILICADRVILDDDFATLLHHIVIGSAEDLCAATATASANAMSILCTANRIMSNWFPDRNLSSTRFPGALLRGAIFQDFDLEDADLAQCTLANTKFVECSLVRANFEGVDWGETKPFGSHTDWVRSVSVSDELLACCTESGVIALYDVFTQEGAQVLEFTGHTGPATCVCFSPLGDTFASCGDDKQVHVWSAAGGDCLQTLSGHAAGVTCVRWSPNSKVVFSSSSDDCICVWAAELGDLLHSFSAQHGVVNAIAISSDGKYLASCGDDFNVRLWSGAGFADGDDEAVRELKEAAVLAGHTDHVTAVAFSGDGQLLASCGFDNTVRLWNIATAAILREIEAHTGAVTSIAFGPDGTTFITGSVQPSSLQTHKTLRLWESGTGSLLRTFEGHTDRVQCAIMGRQGMFAYSCGNDTTLRRWNMQRVLPLHVLDGHRGRITCASFSPDAATLYSCSFDKCVRAWDATNAERIIDYNGHTDQVRWVSVSFDGRLLATCSFDQSVGVWDAASGRVIHTLLGHTDRLNGVSFSDDGTRLASCADDNTVRIWDVSSGAEIAVLQGHTAGVRCIAFGGRQSGLLASCSDDATVRLWTSSPREPQDGEACLRVFEAHSGRVNTVAFDAKGELLVSASRDKTVRMWDCVAREPSHVLNGHTKWVNGAVFSPCDRPLVLSCSDDRAVRQWDPATGQLLHTIELASTYIIGLALGACQPTTGGVSDATDLSMVLWERDRMGVYAVDRQAARSTTELSSPSPAEAVVPFDFRQVIAVASRYGPTVALGCDVTDAKALGATGEYLLLPGAHVATEQQAQRREARRKRAPVLTTSLSDFTSASAVFEGHAPRDVRNEQVAAAPTTAAADDDPLAQSAPVAAAADGTAPGQNRDDDDEQASSATGGATVVPSATRHADPEHQSPPSSPLPPRAEPSKRTAASHSGLLSKFSIGRGLAFLSNWQNRFFVLDGGVLRYFKDHTRSTLRGNIKVDSPGTRLITKPTTRTHPKVTDPEFDFVLVFIESGKEKRLLMRAASAAEHDAWCGALSGYARSVDDPDDM